MICALDVRRRAGNERLCHYINDDMDTYGR